MLHRPALLQTLRRSASTMVLERSKMSGVVVNNTHRDHKRGLDSIVHREIYWERGDTSHPTGFYRDGYCWGSEDDPGRHYVGGIVTKEFLEFSKSQGNDLSTPRPGFAGLREGCKWCLCVARWKEALLASTRLGERVVPRVDLSATALDTLQDVSMEDLQKYRAE